ncbi:alpha/beta-hydrolase [Lizonia empirigonia]|nr:alpha/beta-hydrolase [Lizonia empirigonia]
MAINYKQSIPKTGTCTKLIPSIAHFLKDNASLHLGGDEDFHSERRKHLSVFGIHAIPSGKQHAIGSVEFTSIRGPHGTIPVRVLYPKSGASHRQNGEAGALVYFHGGGYTVGSVDEFENGLRLLAEESGVQVYGIDYRLAPEHKFPVQLDEYDAVIDWLQSGGGKEYGKKALNSQILLYPEATLPFDTPAAVENNSGYYLECNGIFSFADHYLPRGTPPSHTYISPGMQDKEYLKGQSRASVYTSGFDPLRDVGVEYAHKSKEAGNEIAWRHYDGMTHGWLQMTAWSDEAKDAVKDVAMDLNKFTYGEWETTSCML